MKRFLLVLLCSVLTLSYTASEAANQPVKVNVENIATDKTAEKAQKVIKQWALNKDEFLHTESNPHVLEKKVASAVEALMIVQGTLLSQSVDFKAEDKYSKNCTYESDQLRVYYTEIGSANVLARAVVIFNLNTTPDVYILVFKK